MITHDAVVRLYGTEEFISSGVAVEIVTILREREENLESRPIIHNCFEYEMEYVQVHLSIQTMGLHQKLHEWYSRLNKLAIIMAKEKFKRIELITWDSLR